jgi:mannose-6-phosphate isomerase-like protein (cupin superfamily)
MPPGMIDLNEKLASFADPWQPKIIGQLNDYHLNLAEIQGEFVWHAHPETDEVFLVLGGAMAIEFRDGTTELAEGQLCIVPKGVEHRPRAESECQILLIEPAGTRNTGDAGGDMTAEDEVWI